MPKVIKTKTEFEGHVFEEYVVVEGEGLSAWEPQAPLKFVGQKTPRIDGPERVTGRALYTFDVQLPGMLYGKILRSPHPHAKIKKLDTRRAAKLPGVRAVLSYKNTPKISFRQGQTFVFDEIVRYVGDEVACVIADDEEIAEDALELIEVEYELLPFVLDPEEALQPHAPKVQLSGNLLNGKPDLYERGDLDQGFAQAGVIVEGAFKTQCALHNCMETHGSVALWEGDSLTIWDSTQHIFGVRAAAAQLLGLPLNKVRVIKKYMGGGFGSKNGLGKYTVIAALGAKMTGRPVKIMLDRHEENLAAGNRPATVQHLKIGAKHDGTLTALELRASVGAGAFCTWPPSVGGPARQLYLCPNVKTEQHTVFTNTGPLSAFRAPGYVEGTFALESLMDELARKLDIDPIELRLKNYTEIDQMTGRPYSTKGLREAYERGTKLFGWDLTPRSPSLKGRGGSPPTLGEGLGERFRRGFGMASQIWSGNGSPPAYALVKLNPDGTATVISGTQDIGTGTKTVLAQVAAEELDFPIEKISVEIGDTQLGPYAPLSAGSMTVASVGPAVRVAAHDARQQLLDIAAQVLEVPRESLTICDGLLSSSAIKEPVAVKDVLEKLENFMIIGRGAREPNPEDVTVNTFGVQFAEVAVDTETGEVKVERIVAVHDSGRVINPLTLSSQIEGGIIQGLGYALCEQRVVDKATGVVINGNLENYKLPTALDIPEIVFEMVDQPDPRANNLGVKGVGEPPIIPTAAAIANAVADAIGVRISELPITRDKVLKALKKE
ncbi:xanthine dehydrogenase family protein molybdopterin-binding subunit [Candidatus Acetothermia bacterium]|jgi:xanthine dehydrogenase YagR molybdenum-binding subunit|nr:xanthine dehydrogenase family protein molybdopterin-binding subunit [Candidatus Acetothermia bacterium]MCI2437452.1 xanthine dehydrogenase family protein molybdopterin-binding subunit [Candidatus Acetothermia bacterium]